MKNLAKEASNEVIDKILKSHKLSAEPNDWKKSEFQSLINAFLECGKVIFADCAMPMAFMKHYVSGGGAAVNIQLNDLFSEDAGAAERVFNEIVRRHLGNETLRETAINARSTPSNGTRIDPIITILQRNFSTLKWWGSLGTYNTSFSKISETGNKEALFQIDGSGIYMWHEDRKGLSEKIHKMGIVLKDWGHASNFEMKGATCVRKLKLDILTKDVQRATSLTQSNPNNKAELMYEYGKNVLREYPLVAAKYIPKFIGSLFEEKK